MKKDLKASLLEIISHQAMFGLHGLVVMKLLKTLKFLWTRLMKACTHFIFLLMLPQAVLWMSYLRQG